jgi:hypothetical protein
MTQNPSLQTTLQDRSATGLVGPDVCGFSLRLVIDNGLPIKIGVLVRI